jgi:hypothetical protein
MKTEIETLLEQLAILRAQNKVLEASLHTAYTEFNKIDHGRHGGMDTTEMALTAWVAKCEIKKALAVESQEA